MPFTMKKHLKTIILLVLLGFFTCTGDPVHYHALNVRPQLLYKEKFRLSNCKAIDAFVRCLILNKLRSC